MELLFIGLFAIYGVTAVVVWSILDHYEYPEWLCYTAAIFQLSPVTLVAFILYFHQKGKQ